MNKPELEFYDHENLITIRNSVADGMYAINVYGSVGNHMEIAHSSQTGEILSIEVASVSSVHEADVAFPQSAELDKERYIDIGECPVSLGIQEMGDFEIRYSKTDMAILFDRAFKPASVATNGRLLAYYDEEYYLCCIRVSELEELEYLRLRLIAESVSHEQ